jgi:hypothetical protein
MMDDQSREAKEPAEEGQGTGVVSDGSRLVTCDYCDTELELEDEELSQGWFVCPECDQLSHLDEPGGGAMDSSQAPGRGADDRSENQVEWVHLEKVSGAEEASLVVAFLRANGVAAITWQEGAGRAYGLTVGALGVTHIMVREDQEQLARSILEVEVEEDPGDDQAD